MVRWTMMLVVAVILVTGCNMEKLFSSHVETMDQTRHMLLSATERIGGSEAVAQILAGVAANNPGIRISAGQEYYVEAKYVGLSGQGMGAMSGKAEPLPSEIRMLILDVARDSSLTVQRREELINGLIRGWMASRGDPAEPATTQPAAVMTTPPPQSVIGD